MKPVMLSRCGGREVERPMVDNSNRGVSLSKVGETDPEEWVMDNVVEAAV